MQAFVLVQSCRISLHMTVGCTNCQQQDEQHVGFRSFRLSPLSARPVRPHQVKSPPNRVVLLAKYLPMQTYADHVLEGRWVSASLVCDTWCRYLGGWVIWSWSPSACARATLAAQWPCMLCHMADRHYGRVRLSFPTEPPEQCIGGPATPSCARVARCFPGVTWAMMDRSSWHGVLIADRPWSHMTTSPFSAPPSPPSSSDSNRSYIGYVRMAAMPPRLPSLCPLSWSLLSTLASPPSSLTLSTIAT